MEHVKIRKWIRIIALWLLVSSLGGICFYVLVQVSVIDESFTNLETFDFYVSTLMGLTIFVGLWRCESWGWKAAIILIPLSWVLGIYELFVKYERGIGIVTAPFIIIDALILNYLFRPSVRSFLSITSNFLLRFQWVAKVFLFVALFLVVNDIFGEIVGVITVMAVVFGIGTAKKYKERLKASKSNS